MASRKDKKGRVFRKGEGYSDAKEMYYYSYTDPFGKRRYIYSKDLLSLREKEEQLKKARSPIDVHASLIITSFNDVGTRLLLSE
mgnify:CR=1 FL=1